MRLNAAFLLCLTTSALTAAPAYAQEQEWNTRWSPLNVEASARKFCKIPPAYLSISMDHDGRAWVQQSPSVTTEQSSCVAGLLKRYNIALRDSR
ncbi:hypothetical protein PX699_02750 [Sphingobium sp. H39-3-25]|uniref:hypothetical protein n=1 Tax=Sphingobium arseniciresistens TaxID=3030834 RepID=UPI0023B9A9EF|nr:hypothetical protein [Sphingobium arseniciresistens]